ncbi:MAG: DUF5684 domain-containing protein [Deltaproteobacteria bacterium]
MDNLFGIIVFLVIYAYLAYSLQVIADKTNTENSWLAWIPIANIYLMCKIAGKPGWWLILFLIPIVNIVIGIIVLMKIAELRGKPGWVGILWILPVVGLIIPGYLAFSD